MLKKIFNKFVGLYQVCKDSPAYNTFNDYESFCKDISFEYKKVCIDPTRSLDLGCGNNIKNPFAAEDLFGVDIVASVPNSSIIVKKADLSFQKIPYEKQTFDFCTAHDFIEHVPRHVILSTGENSLPITRFPFIELMNEVYSILKPGGYFLSVTPGYPFSISFCDPTHVNHINEHTFVNYFSTLNLGSIYGFKGSFKLIKQGWRGRYLVTILKKI
jgi:SAM-dependent methyltransferase